MIPLLPAVKKYGFSSPYGAVLFSCILFAVAWVFPPPTYQHSLYERDGMFLDPLTAIFFVLCVIAFLVGLRLNRLSNPKGWLVPLPKLRCVSHGLYLALPYFAAVGFCIADLIHVGGKLDFIALLAARQGQQIKEMQQSGFAFNADFWTNAPIMDAAMLWWFLFRVRQIGFTWRQRIVLMLFWFFALMLGVAVTVSTVDRTHLTPVVVGSALVFLYRSETDGRRRIGPMLTRITVGICAVFALFMGISVLRGNAVGNVLIRSMLGYTIVSYNRLTYLLHGKLTFQYGGRGLYLFTYLQNPGSAEKYIPFVSSLGLIQQKAVWLSEFSSVGLAGLNSGFNWVSVMGYVYCDIGWLAPVYFLLSGIMIGYAWTRFRRGSTMAVVTYPSFAIWILFWNGANFLFETTLEHLLMAGVLLTIWDRLMTLPVRAPQEVPRDAGLVVAEAQPV